MRTWRKSRISWTSSSGWLQLVFSFLVLKIARAILKKTTSQKIKDTSTFWMELVPKSWQQQGSWRALLLQRSSFSTKSSSNILKKKCMKSWNIQRYLEFETLTKYFHLYNGSKRLSTSSLLTRRWCFALRVMFHTAINTCYHINFCKSLENYFLLIMKQFALVSMYFPASDYFGLTKWVLADLISYHLM